MSCMSPNVTTCDLFTFLRVELIQSDVKWTKECELIRRSHTFGLLAGTVAKVTWIVSICLYFILMSFIRINQIFATVCGVYKKY